MSKAGELQKYARFVAIVCIFEILPEEPIFLLSPAVVQPQVAMVTFMGWMFETGKPVSLHYLLADILAPPITTQERRMNWH